MSDRQINVERTSVTRLCINVNETMVAHDNAVNNRKPKPRSPAFLFCRKEWLEDMLPNVFNHSKTCIFNRDADIVTILSSGELVSQFIPGDKRSA